MLLLAALLLAAPHRVCASNEASDDVAVIQDDALVARIAVGKRPRGLKLGPGGKLYVAVSGSPRGGPGQRDEDLPPPDRKEDGIAVVDLALGKTVARLPGGPDPESFDLTPDGRLLFVSNEDAAALSVVDIAAARIVRTVKVGAQPEGVTVAPDGKTVYVTSEEDGRVDVIDTRSFKVLARPEVAARPRAIAFTPDGTRAFVSAEQGAAVDVIDARSLRRGVNVRHARVRPVRHPRRRGRQLHGGAVLHLAARGPGRGRGQDRESGRGRPGAQHRPLPRRRVLQLHPAEPEQALAGAGSEGAAGEGGLPPPDREGGHPGREPAPGHHGRSRARLPAPLGAEPAP